MRVRIIGLGEVGARLALCALEAGVEVVGVDTSSARRLQLSSGIGEIESIVSRFLSTSFILHGNISDTGTRFDATFICVPTWNAVNGLDADLVLLVISQVAPHLSDGEVISIESSVPIGTSAGPVRELLESKGYAVGKSVFVVSSPERIDVSIKETIREIPKIVGGVTNECTEKGLRVYERLASNVVVAESSSVAEAAKLLENAFRLVNIAFVNEFADVVAAKGLDPLAVIRAASTKPFGFMPFLPHGGAGGHCVPAAGRAIQSAAIETGVCAQTVEAANASNDRAGSRLGDLVRKRTGLAAGGTILVAGIAYKDYADTFFESVAIKLIDNLLEAGYVLYATDVNSDFKCFVPSSVHCRMLDDLPEHVDVIVVCSWQHRFSTALHAVQSEHFINFSPHYSGGQSVFSTPSLSTPRLGL